MNDITYVVYNYGHLVERKENLTGVEFSQRIAKTYDLNNPRNKQASEIAKELINIERDIFGALSITTHIRA